MDIFNLVYDETQDQKVYQVLSRRLKDKFDIFGGLPDTIEDDWIEAVEKLAASPKSIPPVKKHGATTPRHVLHPSPRTMFRDHRGRRLKPPDGV